MEVGTQTSSFYCSNMFGRIIRVDQNSTGNMPYGSGQSWHAMSRVFQLHGKKQTPDYAIGARMSIQKRSNRWVELKESSYNGFHIKTMLFSRETDERSGVQTEVSDDLCE